MKFLLVAALLDGSHAAPVQQVYESQHSCEEAAAALIDRRPAQVNLWTTWVWTCRPINTLTPLTRPI
jgi:hypothetical protein